MYIDIFGQLVCIHELLNMCVALHYDQRHYNASWVYTRCVCICTFIRI